MSTPILIEPTRQSNIRPIVSIILVIVVILIIIIFIWIFFINGSTSSATATTTPTAGCTSNAGCTNGQKCHIVNGFGVCVACLSNSDCTNVTGKPVCFTNTGVCVECREPADCASTPATPTCNVNNSSCVGCLTNPDCTGNANGSICDPQTTKCVQCLQQSDCNNPNLACGSTNTCVPAYTCPAITIPACDGHAISSGNAGDTYCADGLQEYECTSSGWTYTGSSCVCPSTQYFTYLGQFVNNVFFTYNGITSNAVCVEECTNAGTACNATTWDGVNNICYLLQFSYDNGTNIYVEDPNRAGVYVSYSDSSISGNVINNGNFSGLTLDQCLSNCQNLATAVAQYQTSGGNCACISPNQPSSNSNDYYTSFKEVNL